MSKAVETSSFDITLSEVRILLEWYDSMSCTDDEVRPLSVEDVSLRNRLKTLEGSMVRRVRNRIANLVADTPLPPRMRMRNIRKGLKD